MERDHSTPAQLMRGVRNAVERWLMRTCPVLALPAVAAMAIVESLTAIPKGIKPLAWQA
jgi:hypothetical protein